jgi:hypothetical protein
MTFKPDNCIKCYNRGFYYVAVFPSFETEEVFCNCWHGEQLQIIKNRMSHPEYENPFLSMSDEEIIDSLTRASDNKKAIDLEFE